MNDRNENEASKNISIEREPFSRQVSLRMPEALWRQLSILSVEQGRSLNRQIVYMLEKTIRLDDEF